MRLCRDTDPPPSSRHRNSHGRSQPPNVVESNRHYPTTGTGNVDQAAILASWVLALYRHSWRLAERSVYATLADLYRQHPSEIQGEFSLLPGLR